MDQKVQYILKWVFMLWMFSQSNVAAAQSGVNHSWLNITNLMFVVLIVLIVLLAIKAKSNASEINKLKRELKQLSRTDNLTQLFSRTYLEKRLYEVFERHLRNKSSNSVLMMVGVDGYSRLLKNSGQSAGDMVIKTTTKLLLERIRNTDLCGRFSADCFLILLRDSGIEPAQKLAEEIRLNLQNTDIRYGEQYLNSTCSIGLSAYAERMVSCRDWIQQADQALNRAKQLGGNQKTVY